MKIGVSGASGRMGSLVAGTIKAADDLHLIALYDAHTAGNIAGLSISQDTASLDGCDVIVEFSRPEVVMENLAIWRSFGASVVVGTSGEIVGERTGKLSCCAQFLHRRHPHDEDG